MPFQADQVFQDLLMHVLQEKQDYLALARCISVCTRWRHALTRLPIAFIDALPAVINTFRERILTVKSHTPQTEMFVGEVVANVVKGLQDYLYYRLAVKAFIAQSHNILDFLCGPYIHPGTLARPSMWLLLVVLKVYPRDADLGLEVMRLIARYKSLERALQGHDDWIMYNQADSVVLSDEQQVTATRVVDDFLEQQVTATRVVEASLAHTAQYRQELHRKELIAHCQRVREWIAEGTLLTKQ